MSEKLLYTEEEFAALTGISKLTLKTWRSREEGPPYVKLGRMVRYSHKTVMQYIDGKTHSPERGGRKAR